MTANAAPSAKPYVQIRGLVKKFGDDYAVDHIDLDIEQHEMLRPLGSSGSGKSTLLRMLAGMETPDRGEDHCRRPGRRRLKRLMSTHQYDVSKLCTVSGT